MSALRIRLFGVPALARDGHEAPIVAAKKALALLGYLVCRGEPVARGQLAALLWGDTTDYRSRRNLTHALGLLAASLPGCLHGDHHSVRWRPPGDAWVDVSVGAELLAPPAEARPEPGPWVARLEQGVALYRGELLAGLALADCPDFETWLVRERERWHRLTSDAHAALVAHHAHRGDPGRAEHYARRWIELEPWEEEAHRALMRLLFYRGRPAEALAQLELCRRALADEFAVEPDAATLALADEIRRGTLDRAGRRPPDAGLARAVGEPRGPLADQAPLTSRLVGREAELAVLGGWVGAEGARVVTITGIGGAGKTTLAAALAERLSGAFEAHAWCSLVNAPPLAETLRLCLRALGGDTGAALPARSEALVSALLELLGARRCLLVLDNVESLLEPGAGGPYRPGCADYGLLFAALAARPHRGCLVLTGRELPPELAAPRDPAAGARTLALGGLAPAEAAGLLADYGLRGSPAEAAALAERFAGIPLALRLIAATIHELFDGAIAAFLGAGAPILGDVRALLDRQFARLSALEQDAMLWLAVERIPLQAALLADRLAHLGSRADLLGALQLLRRRSLVEAEGGALALQNVVLEYATDYLVRAASAELAEGRPDRLGRYPLLLARAEEPVRQAQARLLLRPVVETLRARLGPDGLRLAVGRSLTVLRAQPPRTPGYGAANLLQIALHAGVAPSELDLADLCVWEADLRRAALPGLRLAGADLSGCAFTETFDRPLAVAFSPDGRALAAGTATGQIRLWSAGIWQPSGALDSGNGFVSALAFSPDAATLAANGPDHSVSLWRLAGGQVEAALAGHASTVYALAFSPDGKRLATASQDETVRLWDAASSRALGVLRGHGGPVWGVCFSPDGELLASASFDQTVRVWDAGTGAPLATLRGHGDKVSAVAFSPDGRLLASAGLDRAVVLWERATWSVRATLRGHTDLVHAVAFSPDGRTLASCSDDHGVVLWDVTAARSRARLEGHRDYVRGVSFSPDGRRLASASGDQTVRIWEVEAATCAQTLHGHAGMIFALALLPGGGLACGGVDGRIYSWDAAGAPRGAPVRGHADWLRALAASGDTLASGGGDRAVRLWDAATGELRRTLEGHDDGIYALAFSPDGRLLASGGQDCVIRVWHAPSGRLLHSLRRHSIRVAALAFSPDGRTLASSGIDGVVALWDATTGEHRADLLGPTGWVCAVAYCPATGDLLSAGLDQVVRVWDVAAGRVRQELAGHKALVNAVAVSPDGRLVASGGFDRAVRLWDRASGEQVAALAGHAGTVNALAFTPDGRALVSVGADETARVWDMPGGAVRAALRVEGPYQGVDITGAHGLSDAQRASLRALGAVERSP
ncbi:MAG TPA: BTAD domain-containing putative transcriptional regulator [Chloroflexaceae bacterium]|nr:BTAD domain-containing putative transcriptional regulator [Chloroflexaceae bacterium]